MATKKQLLGLIVVFAVLCILVDFFVTKSSQPPSTVAPAPPTIAPAQSNPATVAPISATLPPLVPSTPLDLNISSLNELAVDPTKNATVDLSATATAPVIPTVAITATPIFASDPGYQSLIDSWANGWTNDQRNHAIWMIAQSSASPFSQVGTCWPPMVAVLQGMSNAQIYPLLTATDINTIKADAHIAPLVGTKCPA